MLAESGARGLTHRAVDLAAGVPTGTASNYFASRDALIEALVERRGRTPDPDAVATRRIGRGIATSWPSTSATSCGA